MIQLLRRSALLVLFFAATSCLKPPSMTDDNGPEVAANEVQKTVLSAWDGADFNSIKLNEFLYIEQDQKISSLDPRVVYKEASQIIARTEIADAVNYKFLIRSQAMENGSFKPVTSYEDNISAAKSSPSVTNDPTMAAITGKALPNSVDELQKSMADGSVGVRSGNGTSHFLGVLTVQNMLSACVKGDNWDVTCHNLRTSEGVMSPPTGVSGQQNCGGISNCQIRYKKVAFDLVVNFKDEASSNPRTEKVIYEMTFSPDVPYLSRLIEFCYQGMVPTATQKVLVKICNRVQNFEPGQN
jgi:hypothetical protein